MDKRITGRMSDGTAFVLSETGNEGVGHFTTQRRLPEIIIKLAKLEDKIEQGRLVEVVRCKDCKHRDKSGLCQAEGQKLTIAKDDHFCSKGERRSDNG